MRTKSSAQTTVHYIILSLITTIILFPVGYIFLGSFIQTGMSFASNTLTLNNYRTAMAATPLLRQLLNSLLVTALQTCGQVVTSILAAYALVFCQLRHERMLLVIFLMSMMIPQETTVLSNYLTITAWHLIDTIPAIALPYLALAFNVFLFRQSFRSFPSEMQDAAMLDGAGHMRFMLSILIPMNRAPIMAATINSAIAAWNGFFWPLLVTNSPEMRTIQVGIAQLSGSEASDIGVVLAGTVIAIIPPLILVLAGQKFLRGISIAGALR